MKKLFKLLWILILLSGCDQGMGKGSFAQIVVVNGIEYNGTEEKLEDYEVDRPIGNVLKEVPPNVSPENFQSNFFEEGAVIYAVKNSTDFIIVKDVEENLHLLQKVSGNNP